MKFLYSILIPFITSIILIGCVLSGHSAIITSTATGGTWGTAGTWVGGIMPATGDAVIIATTGTGAVNIKASLTQTAAGSVTVNSGATLNVTSTGVSVSFGALTINTGGTATFRRNLTVQGATSISGTINFGSTSTTSRTMTFTGTVILNSGAVWNETATSAIPKITMANSFTNNATNYSALTGVHTFSGTGTIGGTTANIIPNVAITGTRTNIGILTVSTALSGAGTLTNGNGTSGTLNIGGTATITNLTAIAANSLVNYYGVAQTAKVTTYNNLTLSGSAVKTFATTPTVNRVFSLEGTATVIVTTGVVTYGSSATLYYNTSTARTATTEEWISPFLGTGGIIISNTGAITTPGIVQLGNNTSVPLTISVGATLTPGANLITLHGDFINSGTLTPGSGGVTIAGTVATQSIAGFSTTGSVSLTKTSGTATFQANVNGGPLTINGTGTGTLNLGIGLTHTFTGIVTLTGGILNGGSSIINENAVSTSAWNGTGSIFSAGTGTVNFGAAGDQTLSASITTFNNLTVSNSGVKTFTNVPTLNKVLSLEGAATISAAPTYGSAATLQYNTATSRTAGVEWITPFVASGGIIIASTGTISMNAAKVFNATAPLTVNSGSALSFSSWLLTLNGNFVNNGGTAGGTSGGVTITGTANQSIGAFTTTGTVSMTKTGGTATLTGNVNGRSLTINGSGGTINLGIGLTHTFTGDITLTAGSLNGGSSQLNENSISATSWNGAGNLYTANAGTVNFGAAGNQTVATNSIFFNLSFSGSGNKTLTNVTTISNNLSISGSAVADLGNGATDHTSKSLTLGGSNQASGTWGGTAASPNFVNNTYFLSTATRSLNVNCTAPSEPTSGGNQTICSGTTIPALSVSVSSGTADWYSQASGGTLLQSNSLTYTPVAAGTFYAETDNAGCLSASRTGVTLTENPNPTVLALTGSTICTLPGSNGTITSTTSVAGINYQLYNSGNATVQTVKAGTGTGLIWSGLTAGNGYYVKGTNATTNCTSTSNTVNISTFANPTVPVLSGSLICASPGNDGSISSSTSQTGVNYQLYTSGNAVVQLPQAGTGSALIWAGLTTGTGYYVIATNATTSCISSQSNAVDITTTANPLALVLSGSTICASPGNNGTITSSTSQTSVEYQLYDNSDLEVGIPVTGTGTSLIWSSLSPGTLYYTIGTNSITFCDSPNSNAVDVATTSNPTITSSAIAANVCFSSSTQASTLVFSATTGSPDHYTISWNTAAHTAGIIDLGSTAFSTSPLNIPIAAGVAGGIYSGTLIVSSGSCSSSGNLFTVTVNTAPAAPTGSTSQIFCNGSTVANLAATGTTIQWYTNSSGGTALASSTTLVNGTHYYASQTVNGCESSSRLNVTATVIESGSWIGTSSTNWFTGTNWCGGIVPTTSTNVIIPAGLTNYPSIGTTGAVCNNITINAGASLTITGSNTLNVSGNWTRNGSFIANSSTIAFNGSSVQNISASNFYHVTFSGAGIKSATGALAVVGNLTISSNFSAGSFSHTLQGNWSNNGTFTANTSTFSFNGATAQSIGGSATTTFYNLKQNGNGIITLGITTSVSGILTLTLGKIDIGIYDLTIALGGSISGGSSTNYIKTSSTGRLKQSVAGLGSSKIYPVGNTSYNPMTVTYNDISGARNFSIRVADGTTTNANSSKTVNRKWYLVSDVAGTASLTLTATYNPGEEGSGFTNSSNPQIAYFDGTSWSYRPLSSGSGTTTFTASGSAPDFSNTSGYFVLGSDNAFNAVKLAVTNLNPDNPALGAANTQIFVQSQNSNSVPTMVMSATAFDLSCNNTTMAPASPSGTIAQYAYETSVSLVAFTTSTYQISPPQYLHNATVIATRTSGESLTAGTSSNFDVYLGTIYEPVASENWDATNGWKMSTDGGSTWINPATLPVNNVFTDDLLISIPAGITLTANVTASFYSMLVYGTLDISSLGDLTLNHSANSDYNLHVHEGTLKNSGGTLSNNNGSYPTELIEIHGGTYWHNMNGGSIPYCSWTSTTTASTCKITGITSTAVTAGLDQTFENFTWDNASQSVTQTLTADITINKALTLSSGTITTGIYHVIVGLDGTASNSGAGYIIGTLRRYVASTVTTGEFPVGDAGAYAPFSISCIGTPSGNGFIDVSTTAAQPPAASGLSQTKYINRKWTITNYGVGGITAYSPGCSYLDADKVGSPSTGSLRLRKFTVNTWYTTNGAATGNTITATGLSTTGLFAASDFYVGEDDCSSTNAVWLGSSSTDWNVAGNWCSGSVPGASTDVIIPSSPSRQPVIGPTGGICRSITLHSGASLSFSGAYSLDVKGNWSNSGAFTSSTGTVSFSGSTPQTISGSSTVFNNLIINNTTGVTGLSNFTVNGILNLTSANPDATQGTLNMGIFTLNMLNATASVAGNGDVTGIVKRTHIFTPNVQYQFGSQFTTLNFINYGTQPNEISCRISIGAAPAWRPTAVQRYYSFAQTGTTGTDKATLNLRYLTSELQSNEESKLVLWDKHYTGGSIDEHGKTNNSTTDHWVGLIGQSITYVAPTTLDNKEWDLADYTLTKNTWLGADGTNPTKWDVVSNWSAGHMPLSTEDVLIQSGKSHYPVLTLSVEVKTLEIETGASLAAGSNNITINGYNSAWQNHGTFDPGTGTVFMTHGNINHIVTVTGTTQFHDISIAANTFIRPEAGTVMNISGAVIGDLSCIVDLSSYNNTVEYNGTDQYIVNPSTIGFAGRGYYNLIISGTGAFLVDDLDISGNYTNIGTLSTGTGTVSFIGTTEQHISGAGDHEYYNLTVNNPAGVTSSANITVDGTLYLQSDNPSLLSGSLTMSSGKILNMGVNSGTVGIGDVTGIISRTHTFAVNTDYSFGNENTVIRFPEVTGQALPTAASVKVTLGSPPNWGGGTPVNGINRMLDISQTGGNGTKAILKEHFRTDEIPAGLNPSLLSFWIYKVGVGIYEKGRTDVNTTTGYSYVSVDNVNLVLIPANLNDFHVALAPTAATTLLWNGSQSTDWTDAANWTPNNDPAGYAVLIPDAYTTPYSPQIPVGGSCKSVTISANGIINAVTGATLSLTAQNTVWAVEAGGIFNAGNSTVKFTRSNQSISGTTDFFNISISDTAKLSMQDGCVMGIAGTVTKNTGVWSTVSAGSTTVNYNGGAQTVVIPDASTNRYYNLILSGSGAKTMPLYALNIVHNFTISGTASVTAAAPLTFDVNVTIGTGSTFDAASFTHIVKGDWTNNGTFTASSSTINFNGSSAQTINGETTFSTLKINNANGVTLGAAINVSTLTIGDNITNSVFNDGGFQISSTGTFNFASGIFRIGNGSSATSYPGFTTDSIYSGTTVDYGSTATQTIAAGNYHDLSNSGDGDRILSSTGTIRIAGEFLPGSGSYIVTGSTVEYNGIDPQDIDGLTYNNLTISGTGTRTASGNINVNGILNLNKANASATEGALNMVGAVEYVLYMGATATTTGTGDVSGYVNRSNFELGTNYTFGNQFTLMNFTVGPLPTSVTLELYLPGSNINWKTDAIQRYYDVVIAGGSAATRLRFNAHYLDSELNGNTEGNMDLFDYHLTGNIVHDHGRSDYNITDNWIGFSNVGLVFLSANPPDDHFWTMGDNITNGVCTWIGGSPSGAIDWDLPGNWEGGVPISTSNAIIPAGCSYWPLLPNAARMTGTLDIQQGAVLNATTGTPELTIAGSGNSWQCTGTLNAGSGTVLFTSTMAIMSGTTDFNNVTVADAAILTLAQNNIMRIAGTLSLGSDGELDAATFVNTIVYSGASQSTVNPNGIPAGYHNLVLSGSGTKTFPSETLYIHGDLTMNAAASLSGSTIDMNGTIAQLLSGSSVPAFNSFTVSNTLATVTAGLNLNCGGDFTNSGTLDMSQHSLAVTGTVSNTGTIKIAVPTTSSTSPLPAAKTWGGTVEFNGSDAQTTVSGTYNNLTINNVAGVTASDDLAVNGILNLQSDNPNTTHGSFDLVSGKILNMGINATTVGIGDVTGIIRRTHTFSPDTDYSFGNQNTVINFPDTGTLPTSATLKVTLGTPPAWGGSGIPANGINRILDIGQTGGSGTKARLRAHFRADEIPEGVDPNTLSMWIQHYILGIYEKGKADLNLTPGYSYISIDNVNLAVIPTDYTNFHVAFAPTAVTLLVWNGSQGTGWMETANWTPNNNPSYFGVRIPDESTTAHISPTIPVGASCKSIEIKTSGIINTASGATLALTGTGNAWTCEPGGVYNAGNSTVSFLRSSQTYTGTTNFNNILISDTTTLLLAESSWMGISGTMTNNGVLNTVLAGATTVDYNGAAQTVAVPNTSTDRYYNLVLSGSGAKTMPPTALTCIGDFTVSGTASVTALAALTIQGNVNIGGGATLVASSYSHMVGGNWTKTGNFNATGSTIEFNGNGAGSIGASNFNNVVFSGSGAKTASGALSVAGNLIISDNFTAGAFTHTVGGNWTNIGTFTSTGSTIDFNGTNSATVGVCNFNHIIFSGTGTKLASGELSIAGNLTITDNFTAGSYTYKVGGNFTNTGSFNSAGSTFDFNGSSSGNIGTADFNNIVFSGVGTKTATGALTIAGNLTISNNFTAGSYSHNVGGNWSNNGGSFSCAGSTIIFEGGAAQTIGGTTGTTFNNLTIGFGSDVSINTSGQTLKGILKSNGILAAGGKLTLLSTAGQTALVDGSGTGSVTGTVNMQRYMALGYGYHYICSPFTSSTVIELADDIELGATFPTLFSYDENQANAWWFDYTTTSNTLDPIAAFAANFGAIPDPVVSKTFNISGQVSNGDKSVKLYNHNQPHTNGFVLVGNPYPSPIDWDASSGWTRDSIDNAIYYFNAGSADQYVGCYSTYIGGVSSDGGISNNIIPAMQGFFVHVTTPANIADFPVEGILSFTNSVRVNTINPNFHKKPVSNDIPLVRLYAGFEGVSSLADPLVVTLNSDAYKSFNRSMDAIKLMNTDPEVPSFYILTDTTVKYAIKALPLPIDTVTIIPLGITLMKAGQVSFKELTSERPAPGLFVYLADQQRNTLTELNPGITYTTFIDKGVWNNRFVLIFSLKALSAGYNHGNELDAWFSYGILHVYSGYAGDEGAVLQLTDMLGRVLYLEKLKGFGYHELDINVPQGIYLASLHSSYAFIKRKLYISGK